MFQRQQGSSCCGDLKTFLNWCVDPAGAEKGLYGVNSFVLNVKVLLALTREKENS